MKAFLEQAASRMLFSLDPETAHEMSIAALRGGIFWPHVRPGDARLAVSVAGIDFPNPLGMAAGYDKNAEVPDALLRLGFGFAEVGTITPLPQSGNPKPRVFRLLKDQAVINRLGFNNKGIEKCKAVLQARSGKPGILGINIGANKDSQDRVEDYLTGIRLLGPYASYLTINISSPNTPGLRNLQSSRSLRELLSRVAGERDSLAGRRVPVFLKIAPDLEDDELEALVSEVKAFSLDGIIVSNTTLSRKGLMTQAHRDETGGLSGRPLFARSTMMLAKTRLLAGPELPLIGVGGVDTSDAALEKIRAGADLIQLYTGMIYAGPGLPARILSGISRYCNDNKISRLGDLRDTKTEYWSGYGL